MQNGDRDSFYTVMALSKVRGNQSEGELMALKDRDMYKWHIICICKYSHESASTIRQLSESIWIWLFGHNRIEQLLWFFSLGLSIGRVALNRFWSLLRLFLVFDYWLFLSWIVGSSHKRDIFLTGATKELTRALRVDKPIGSVKMLGTGGVESQRTRGVEECKTGLNEDRWQGVEMPGTLSLAWGGALSEQAQLGPDRFGQIGLDRSVRPGSMRKPGA